MQDERIPVGLCQCGCCVNPAHLEPVTPGENVLRGEGPSGTNARKTHCSRGHELAGANVYHPPKRPRKRECLICRRLATRRAHARAKAALSGGVVEPLRAAGERRTG